jgi:uncharacterized protein (TIGR02266 family)
MMNDVPAIERRKAVRLPVAIPIELRHERGFSLYATSDLSEGGAFFPRSIPHPVGSKLSLTFRLPGEEQAVSCDGEVVNVPDQHRLGMGVRFIGLSQDDAQRLSQFTRARGLQG